MQLSQMFEFRVVHYCVKRLPKPESEIAIAKHTNNSRIPSLGYELRKLCIEHMFIELFKEL